MNRINELFEKKQNNILSIFFTAGYPGLNDTAKIIKSLQNSEVDMIEIGMPFSDPLADGPVIQQSSQVALKNGMSLKLLLNQLKDIRKEVNIPLILMGYLNPVYQFGIERFCEKATETGVDGLILPDLPMQEYVEDYKTIFEKYKLHNIFLITPQTTEERIRKIDAESKGFIYMVASSSTTGAKSAILTEQEDYFKRIAKMNLTSPKIIGFGISTNETFQKACKYANGAIIGSAFIKLLEKSENPENDIIDFANGIK